MKKFILCFLLTLLSNNIYGHPDGGTPYWYPSSFIYGYVEGCYESVEQNQAPFTEEMWPVQVRTVCGCVVDALRHSMTYEEILDNETNAAAQLIVNATFPICIREEKIKSSN